MPAMRSSLVWLLALGLTRPALAVTGPVVWISKKPSGAATADASVGTVSADGQWAAFSTDESLVSADTNGLRDVYLKRLDNGAVTLVSHAAGGTNGGNGVSDPASDPNNYFAIDISVDGRFVVYDSLATDLASGITDTNAGADVFRYDRLTDTNDAVSLQNATRTRAQPSVNPHTSGDGQLIAFGSDLKVWVRDMTSGATVRVDVDRTGGEPDNFAERPDISADGRFVTFLSPATDLVAADNNGVADVFRRDLQANQTVRASVADDDAEAVDGSNHPHISGDGSRIVFESTADNLIGDGNDTNLSADAFLRDLDTGTTTRISIRDNGGQATLGGRRPDISADGTRVSFDTTQDNLGDPDLSNLGVQDVFVRDRVSGKTLLASVAAADTEPIDADAELGAICGSGRFVAFRTRTNRLDSSDSGATQDIYAKDLGVGNDTSAPAISFDGLTASIASDPSGIAMVAVGGQIVRLPADRRVAVPVGGTIEVWDGAGNRQVATAAQVEVTIDGVKVRRKRAQVTFTVTTAPVDGTIEVRRVRKKSEKSVTTESFTQALGQQALTVNKRLAPGRHLLVIVAAGRTVSAPFRVR
jgi:Tol biopolymer transport system component